MPHKKYNFNVTSSSVGINLSNSSQCSDKSPSRSVFIINSDTLCDVCPIRRFAMTMKQEQIETETDTQLLLAILVLSME